MGYALVIHSLLTVISVICLAFVALSTRNSMRLLRGARKHLETVEDFDGRLQSVELGQDKLTTMHHSLTGKYGSLVAKLNQLGAPPERAARLDDTQPIDDGRQTSERDALYQKLAGLNGGR